MIIQVLLFLLVVVIYRYILKPYWLYRKYRKYGDGYFFPIIGDSVELENNIKNYGDGEYSYKHLFDKSTKSRIHVGNFGASVKVRLVDPELIKDFYQKPDCYNIDEYYICNLYRFFGKEEQDPKLHRNFRKIFSPAFSFEYLKNLSSSIEQISEKVLNEAVKISTNSEINPIETAGEISSQVILQSFFGETLSELSFRGMTLPSALSFVINNLCEQMGEFGFLIFGPQYLKRSIFTEHKKIEDFISSYKVYLSSVMNEKVAKYQEEFSKTGDIKQHCILSMLIKSNQINELGDKKLLEFFLGFFLAGMETTSNLVGMTLYYLAKNKAIYGQLKIEIDSNTDYSPNGLSNLPYLNSIIKETLRMQGPANSIFDRIAIKDHQLGDIKIEKGTIVNVFMNAVHRNPLYYENPHEYNPSRWLKESENKIQFTYLPFSYGNRQCIGQHLALIEARILLNTFIKKFNFSIDENYKLILDFKFSPTPLEPLKIKIQFR